MHKIINKDTPRYIYGAPKLQAPTSTVTHGSSMVETDDWRGRSNAKPLVITRTSK